MGFEKAIEHKKTKRKAYRDSKNFDYSCRNHGGCPICEGNRLHKDRTRESSAKAQEEELAHLGGADHQTLAELYEQLEKLAE